MSIDFDRSLPMMLLRTLDAIMPSYREIYARHNLTEQQWRILRVLWQDGTVTATDISRRTLLPTQSLVGILERLEGKGLIRRERSLSDRRQIDVVATEKSEALRAEIMPLVGHIQQTQKACVPAEDWDRILAILDDITSRMKQHKPAQTRILEETD